MNFLINTNKRNKNPLSLQLISRSFCSFIRYPYHPLKLSTRLSISYKIFIPCRFGGKKKLLKKVLEKEAPEVGDKASKVFDTSNNSSKQETVSEKKQIDPNAPHDKEKSNSSTTSQEFPQSTKDGSGIPLVEIVKNFDKEASDALANQYVSKSTTITTPSKPSKDSTYEEMLTMHKNWKKVLAEKPTTTDLSNTSTSSITPMNTTTSSSQVKQDSHSSDSDSYNKDGPNDNETKQSVPNVLVIMPKIPPTIGAGAGVHVSLKLNESKNVPEENPSKNAGDGNPSNTCTTVIVFKDSKHVIQQHINNPSFIDENAPSQGSIVVSADQEGKQGVLGPGTSVVSDKETLIKEHKHKMDHSPKIPVETKITPDIVVQSSSISDQDVVQELIKRKMAQVDDSKTATTFSNKDSTETTVGIQNYGIKLTPLGAAHIANVEKYLPKVISKSSLDVSRYEYSLCSLKPIENTFLKNEKELHVVVIKVEEKYFIIGQLTSHKLGKPLSDEQFKVFQHRTEHPNDDVNVNDMSKKQFFKPNTNAEEIAKDKLTYLQYDQEYLQQSPESFELLKKTVENLSKNPIYIFDNQGHTKETSIQACINHDLLVKESKPQPKTAHQLKQDEENKHKQKEKQKLKYIEKDSNKYEK